MWVCAPLKIKKITSLQFPNSSESSDELDHKFEEMKVTISYLLTSILKKNFLPYILIAMVILIPMKMINCVDFHSVYSG